MKEQNKYDQIPSDNFDRLQRILPLADKVVDEIVCEATEMLEKIIPRMFEVMEKVAKFRVTMSKVDVSVGSHPFLIWQKLSVARTVGGLVDSEEIGEMDKELTRVIKDFDHAVNIEALRLVKVPGTHSFSECDDSRFSVALCRARAFAWVARFCEAVGP